MSDTDDTDKLIKVAIGNLLNLAGPAHPLAIPVISAFDSSATRKRSANCKALLSFNLPNLEACAEVLNISLADADEHKIFTKATLVPRLVDGIESLLPSTCIECSLPYVVDLHPAEPPLLHCFKCFQGSHNCEITKAKHRALEGLVLPAGLVWLCSRCHKECNPIKPRGAVKNTPFSSNSQSLSGTPVPDLKSNNADLVDAASQELLRQQLLSVAEQRDKDEISEKRDTNLPSNVCEKFKSGKCPHGIRGNKVVNGVQCSYTHPKHRCFKYCAFGGKNKKGCSKGSSCKYFHPILCKFSVKNRQCLIEDCTYVHLKGTSRKKEPPRVKPQKKSTHPAPKKRPQTQQATKSTEAKPVPQSPSSFLELAELVKEMRSQFKEEMASLRSNMCSTTSPMCSHRQQRGWGCTHHSSC